MARPKGQQKDETPMEYLRRLVQNCDMEREMFLDDLRSVAAITDFFDLWHHYDTDFWSGILECICEGDSPRAASAFIKKHKLPRSWANDVADAVAASKE